MDYSLT